MITTILESKILMRNKGKRLQNLIRNLLLDKLCLSERVKDGPLPQLLAPPRPHLPRMQEGPQT